MSTLGVHFALSKADLAAIEVIDDPEALVGFVTEDLEERLLAKGTWAYQSDKAWEAIHRCLTDGKLLYGSGPFPRAYAILGGEALDAGEDYTACLVRPAQVVKASVALKKVTRAWLRTRYDALRKTPYRSRMSDQDFDYTWENLEGLRTFFLKAARASRAVLFTTDA